MAYQIDSSCIACGACVAECPTNCISDDGSIYKVNEADCIDCGSCASACPVDAPKQI